MWKAASWCAHGPTKLENHPACRAQCAALNVGGMTNGGEDAKCVTGLTCPADHLPSREAISDGAQRLPVLRPNRGRVFVRAAGCGALPSGPERDSRPGLAKPLSPR